MFPIRIGLVAVIGVLVAIVASRAFDRIVLGLLVPPVGVALVAMAVRRTRWWIRLVTSALGVLGVTVAASVVEGGSLGSFTDDAAAGPRRLLTTEWPSPLDPGVVVALAVALALVTAIAAELAGRPRFHLAPLAPLAAGFAGAMAVSAPVHPAWWALASLAVATALFVVARPGDDPRTRVRLVLAERSMIATLVGLIAAGLVASNAIAWSDRVDPRRDVDADLTIALLSPIEQTAALRSVEPPIDLFSITDRSLVVGPSLPTRWRIAALDQYDGQRWQPSIALRPIGERLGLPGAADRADAPPIRYELTVLTDDIDLVPLPGDPLVVDVADDTRIETDATRTVVRLAATPTPGLVVDVTADLAPTGDAAQVTTLQIDDIAAEFTTTAKELADESTVIGSLRALEAAMRSDDWRLNSDAPGPGQQLALIDRFVNETRTGTREQFVTAFVLLARSLGIEARVAVGFVVPPGELTSPLVLDSSYAGVWPEVHLGDRGWMAFDPVPAEETVQPEDDTPPPSEQSPAAAQPPLDKPPQREDDDETPAAAPIEEPVEWGTFRVWATRAVVAVTVVLVPILAVVGAILAMKWRRRRRRVAVADPARRIVGAWANATDSLIDAGLTIGPSWTDDRIAEHAAGLAPALPHDLRRLASAATAMTFGAPERGSTLVDDAVATSRSVDQAIRSDRNLWQRVRWRLSTRSLRKRTRSPVAA